MKVTVHIHILDLLKEIAIIINCKLKYFSCDKINCHPYSKSIFFSDEEKTNINLYLASCIKDLKRVNI